MNRPYSLLSFCSSLITLCALFCQTALAAAPVLAPAPRVCISKMTDHPALNQTLAGLEAVLKHYADTTHTTLRMRVESAQGNPALAAQIAQSCALEQPQFFVGIGTIAAQSFVKYLGESNTPALIFSSVTDPINAQLAKSLAEPGGHRSGVSNFVPLEPQLQLFLSIQPQLKRLGVLYNPGEANSVAIIRELEKLCPSLGLELVTENIFNSAGITQAAHALALKSDAFFISNDNTALSAIAQVAKITNHYKIPLYVSDTAAVAQGALAALGPNQYAIGEQTGRMILRILTEDLAVGTVPVEFPQESELFLNAEAAAKIGLFLPPELLKKAQNILPAPTHTEAL